MTSDSISQRLSFLGAPLAEHLISVGIIKEIPRGTEVLRIGQFVSAIPIVLDGVIKVLTGNAEKELLLYYIRPLESCVMSFSAGISNEPGRIVAVTETDVTALLIPVAELQSMINKFPGLNMLFHKQYELRYQELLDTVKQLIFSNIEGRLIEYIAEKSEVTGKPALKISHREIAEELGTAREVISRTMKKLEQAGKLKQTDAGISLIGD